jgi:hypothetical protein
VDIKLTAVITAINPKPIASCGTPGNHCCRMIAPAMASTGITMTQKYQYSQPTVNPAQCPNPARAKSVNERMSGRDTAISPKHRMTIKTIRPVSA